MVISLKGGVRSPPPSRSQTGRPADIIAISSHVARGSVGNRAAVFALEQGGHTVWAVPTVTLPWHPGHGPSTRIEPSDAAFAAFCRDLAQSNELVRVGGIISGYLASPSQALAVADLVKAVKAQNPNALYLCDPVLGDRGKLYQPQAILEAMVDHLLPLADMATPNRFELEFLTNETLGDNAALSTAATKLGPRTVLVTSAFGLLTGSMGNLLVEEGRAWLAEHPQIAQAPHGSGDLTAALFLKNALALDNREEILRRTTASVYQILAHSTAWNASELLLAGQGHALSQPAGRLEVRRLGMRRPPRLKDVSRGT